MGAEGTFAAAGMVPAGGIIFCSLQTKSKSEEEASAKPFVMHHFRSRGAVPAFAVSLWHKAAWAGVSVLWDTNNGVSAHVGAVGTSVHFSTPCASSTMSHMEGISCRAQTCPELAPELVELHVSHLSTARLGTGLGGNRLFNGCILCLQSTRQL